MKRFITLSFAFFCSAVALYGCGGGGGGGAAAPAPAPASASAAAAPAPTVATTKMYLFGTMSSATAGGNAGIMDSINTTISSLPVGVTLTSIVPSGAAAAIPVGDASYGFNAGTRALTISLLNSNQTAVVASNAGNGVEVATLNFSLTGGATPPIPTPGTSTTVFQNRPPPYSSDYLNGCVVNFVTTYH